MATVVSEARNLKVNRLTFDTEGLDVENTTIAHLISSSRTNGIRD
jgi:hypothetical protein